MWFRYVASPFVVALKGSIIPPCRHTKSVTNERFECCFSTTRPALWLLDILSEPLTTVLPTPCPNHFACRGLVVASPTKGFNRQQLQSSFRSNILLWYSWLKANCTMGSCLLKQWAPFPPNIIRANEIQPSFLAIALNEAQNLIVISSEPFLTNGSRSPLIRNADPSGHSFPFFRPSFTSDKEYAPLDSYQVLRQKLYRLKERKVENMGLNIQLSDSVYVCTCFWI